MPTVTIDRSVTIQETAEALQQKLGDGYKVTTHGQGEDEAVKVKRSVTSLATVRLDHDPNVTTIKVHGGGLVITRLINEFGIAKTVAAAIEEGLKSAPGPGGDQPASDQPGSDQPGSGPSGSPS